MTRKEYEKKIAALEPLDEERRKSVTCALLGHSHITTGCFGYVYCARCGEQIEDVRICRRIDYPGTTHTDAMPLLRQIHEIGRAHV